MEMREEPLSKDGARRRSRDRTAAAVKSEEPRPPRVDQVIMRTGGASTDPRDIGVLLKRPRWTVRIQIKQLNEVARVDQRTDAADRSLYTKV